MIQPPEGFEQSLRNYDAALSLRWGSAVQMWIIERKARISPAKVLFLRNASKRPGVDPKAVEEYRSAQSGRHVIYYVKELDRRVHDYLWANDLQRRGNGPVSQVNAELKGFERDRVKKLAESHDIAVQTADVLHHALKKQSSKIHAGRVDEVIMDGFGIPKAPAPIFSVTRSKPRGLLDQFGRAINADLKSRKIHLATR